MNNRSIQQLTEEHHFKLYRRYPLTLVKGDGSRVWDEDGNEYIDALAGIAVNSVGHCHPDVVAAVQDQASKLMHISNFYYSEPLGKLSERLTKLAGMNRAFFCSSGVEAVEAAVKLARRYGNLHGKSGSIISMENCFHGRSIGAIALGKEKYRQGFEPMPGRISRAVFNDLESVKRKMDDETVAVILEPVQGEGGVRPADPEFLKGVRKLCDRHKALLIFDEIQCGVGRTGKMFAWEHYGVKPDVICLAKALGGGFPIGATLATEKAASNLDYGIHGTTYGGNPLACAAALATLDVMEREQLPEAAAEKGDYLMMKVRERTKGWNSVKEVRGLGLMVGVELNFEGADVVTSMMKKGVLSNCASDTVMRLVPPLNISRGDLDRVIDALTDSIREVASNVGENVDPG